MIIGNGEETRVWQDQWIVQKPARKVQVVRRDLEGWNRGALERLFPDDERRLIEQVRPAERRSKDKYIWDYTKTGQYSVKSVYWVQVNIINKGPDDVVKDQPSLDFLYQLAWKTDASPKVHHFFWRCLSNSLPVAGNMFKRHITREASCLRCAQGNESVNHVLFQCPPARLLWALPPIPAPPGGITSDSLYSNLYHVFNLEKEYSIGNIQAGLVP
ncbi:hypothetical protein Bca52824_033969 [Brassica carinata]|uniref:Reverse transcriptase zinc-binding domain-containing protein n=1 Tax=Brassica carinata TaxID=52824 RepID=A0A8X7SDK8_BRACI|nr:hypothetical protein Bca52824_033969 [Brassica carinata]